MAQQNSDSAADEGAPGRTTIASLVVQKVASVAAREIAGVYTLGGKGVSRTLGAIKEHIPGSGTATTTGVSVEVGEKQAAIDLDLVAGYGARIPEVAQAVRRNVIRAVEQITALEVIEVNLTITDVHLPGEDEADASRVE
ncbi:Asp23/Gls24 family envelope stress response protein [Amycolatopsis panacis]|uniref:Asp23/Gls24 family envelope stress response protein n=1 Tax=Amycolatopsis panacis TaxID=2340917 RepID=A0A419I4E2_9PSEU|nr:Asp23/Gls24 family envelope stress response protein [Amycolatopsis panacis]RJQ85249.1 Asp23/Gls24 family envelope stress response protein [Amycolatopsis panacis]